jgi:hypothetical protein
MSMHYGDEFCVLLLCEEDAACATGRNSGIDIQLLPINLTQSQVLAFPLAPQASNGATTRTSRAQGTFWDFFDCPAA